MSRIFPQNSGFHILPGYLFSQYCSPFIWWLMGGQSPCPESITHEQFFCYFSGSNLLKYSPSASPRHQHSMTSRKRPQQGPSHLMRRLAAREPPWLSYSSSSFMSIFSFPGSSFSRPLKHKPLSPLCLSLWQASCRQEPPEILLSPASGKPPTSGSPLGFKDGQKLDDLLTGYSS